MRNSQERQTSDNSSPMRRDLWESLCVLGLLIAFALSGLAWDENWRKFVRILMGFSAYIIVLLSALRAYALITGRRHHLPFWAFALAGAAAEISSGWLRPNARAQVDLATAIAAALLVGGIHWLALHARRPLREKIVSTERRRAA